MAEATLDIMHAVDCVQDDVGASLNSAVGGIPGFIELSPRGHQILSQRSETFPEPEQPTDVLLDLVEVVASLVHGKVLVSRCVLYCALHCVIVVHERVVEASQASAQRFDFPAEKCGLSDSDGTLERLLDEDGQNNDQEDQNEVLVQGILWRLELLVAGEERE